MNVMVDGPFESWQTAITRAFESRVTYRQLWEAVIMAQSLAEVDAAIDAIERLNAIVYKLPVRSES